MDLTKSFDDVNFGHCLSADVRAHYGVEANTFVLFR